MIKWLSDKIIIISYYFLEIFLEIVIEQINKSKNYTYNNEGSILVVEMGKKFLISEQDNL